MKLEDIVRIKNYFKCLHTATIRLFDIQEKILNRWTKISKRSCMDIKTLFQWKWKTIYEKSYIAKIPFQEICIYLKFSVFLNFLKIKFKYYILCVITNAIWWLICKLQQISFHDNYIRLTNNDQTYTFVTLSYSSKILAKLPFVLSRKIMSSEWLQ